MFVGLYRNMYSNKLSGTIPGTMTLLAEATARFQLHENDGLCRLDDASGLVTDMC
jgi:hypothetical protein